MSSIHPDKAALPFTEKNFRLLEEAGFKTNPGRFENHAEYDPEVVAISPHGIDSYNTLQRNRVMCTFVNGKFYELNDSPNFGELYE